MNLHKCSLTNNDCYRAGRTITPKGVMVHFTACLQVAGDFCVNLYSC